MDADTQRTIGGREALRLLEKADEQKLEIDKVRTDEVLQPRVKRVVPHRHWGRTSELSDEHTATMRQVLEAARDVQLAAILVAYIDGKYFVVDGHHRLRAYRLAKRETIPARVYPMTRRAAVMATKLANCTPRALEMHEHQRREAAWQYVADVTLRGKLKKLPNGDSCQSIASLFHVGKTTVHRMLTKYLPKIDLSDFSEDARDPGTGFPLWKYVVDYKCPWKDMQEMLSVDQLKRHKAEKLAAQIGEALDKEEPEVQRLAMEILAAEARDAAEDDDSIRALAYGDDGDF